MVKTILVRKEQLKDWELELIVGDRIKVAMPRVGRQCSAVCQHEVRNQAAFSNNFIQSVQQEVRGMSKSKVLRIGCVDPREAKDGVYYVGSVGAQVFEGLIENIMPVLAVVGELQLVAHRDCGHSRLAIGLPFSGDLTAEEATRVEEQTLKSLTANVELLRRHPAISDAISTGVVFRAGIDTLVDGIQWIK